MRDGLGDAKRRLVFEIDSHSVLSNQPIAADPSIVSSLLQKSIRRSETEIAQRAALTLLKRRGAAIWRRFRVIAFEDVGIGDVAALTTVVGESADAGLREACGGDLRVVAHLADALAKAPKDRSADYLVGAKDHPILAGFAETVASAPLETKLAMVRDAALSLPQRTTAPVPLEKIVRPPQKDFFDSIDPSRTSAVYFCCDAKHRSRSTMC